MKPPANNPSALPPGYRQCVDAMLREASSWVSANGTRGLRFTVPPKELGLIAELNEQTISMLAPTPEGRSFLLALDKASGHEATAMQAIGLIRALLPFSEWSEDQVAELVKRGRGAGSA